jgi:hypothetical protein
MKFPYQAYQAAPSPTVPNGILYRPEVPLTISGSAGSQTLWPLVDTGSDDTLLPLSSGRMVGAVLDPGQTWDVQGIGGQSVKAILGEVTFELARGPQLFRWVAKVGFVDFPRPEDEFAVVGHAGCLDYFRVTCDGHLHELDIEVTPAFPGQVI